MYSSEQTRTQEGGWTMGSMAEVGAISQIPITLNF